MSYKNLTTTVILSTIAYASFLVVGLVLVAFMPYESHYADIVAKVYPFAVASGIIAIIFCTVLRANSQSILNYLGIRPIKVSHLICWLLLATFINVIILAVGKEYKDLFDNRWDTILFANKNMLPMVLLATTVLTPCFEELLFRGFAYQGLLDAGMHPYVVISLTAVCWGLAHFQYHFLTLLLIMLIGLLLGFARYKSNSIIASFAMHMLINMLQIANYFMMN